MKQLTIINIFLPKNSRPASHPHRSWDWRRFCRPMPALAQVDIAGSARK
jgi:hypothetical protein